MNFGQAFGVTGSKRQPKSAAGGNGDGDGESFTIRPRTSYDEEIRLAPYPFSSDSGASANNSSRINV